jgi:hypothetical protein
MKFKIETITHVKMTVDSSELIMMNKGGMHKIELPGNFFHFGSNNNQDDDEDEDYNEYPKFTRTSKIIISVQLDPSKKGMFDHCTDNKYQESKQ